MKTDSFFYRFFLEFPEAFFALIGQRKWKGQGYKFTSVEVKDIDFRFDGVFVPSAKDALLYFVEAQFTKKRIFYPNFFAKIMNYLQKHKTTNDWRAIVFFPNHAADTGVHQHYREFFESGRLLRVYLTDLPEAELEKFPLNLLKIIIDSKQQVLVTAKKIIRQLPEQVHDKDQQELIHELLTNLLVSTLPLMSRKEIDKMFDLAAVKKSRFYREVAEEMRQELTPKLRQELTPKLRQELTPKLRQELTPKIAQEQARAIARTMLKKDFSLELIAEITGLSQREILTLRRKAK